MAADDATPKPTIDERLQAITQSLELSISIQRDEEIRWNKRFSEIAAAIQQDAENIRALARIAEIHERRLTDLEEGQP